VIAPGTCFESIGDIGAYGADGCEQSFSFGWRQIIDDTAHTQYEFVDSRRYLLVVDHANLRALSSVIQQPARATVR
jgi:hypothetical protein